ncbi:hypothetical protein U1Q18_050517 [Sarracenia purpurea var. burkii]
MTEKGKAHIMFICEEMEAHSGRNETCPVFQKICLIARAFKAGKQNNCDPEEIAEVWRNYYTKLYETGENSKNEVEMNVGEEVEVEPPVLHEEVINAIDYLERHEALGPDGIPTEVFKASSKEVMRKPTYITLYKKSSPENCKNYHASH